MKMDPRILALLLLGALTFVSGGANLQEINKLGDIFVTQITPYRDQVRAWAVGFFSDRPTTKADDAFCNICPIAIGLVRTLVDLGGSDEEITNAIAKVCELFFLGPSPDDICYNTIRGYIEAGTYMIKNSRMTNDDFCGIIREGCGVVNSTLTSWETVIAGQKPTHIEHAPLPVSKLK